MLGIHETLVGSNPAMLELKEYLPRVAQSRATVLITGETGTGKERVAELLHKLGPRSRRPLISINCAALPDSLVESELFGHERGAFTGAVTEAEGHFVRANGGTLVLDEIGDMSLNAQSKLLRVIESQQVTAIGASRARPIDVRIVAATNQPLEDLVRQKLFRADLFYRLNVARLYLPPLRERKEDIPLLFDDAIKQLNQRDGCLVQGPDRELLHCLMEHDWPGNVRELRNLAETIFINPPSSSWIKLRDLPPVFRATFSQYQTTGSAERDRLIEVLKLTQWNKAEAAKQLSWSRVTLYRKLSKYHIDKPS